MEKGNVARTSWFVSAGIDDLAKYRIVELLLRTPGLSGSAHFLIETLGLRPVVLVHQLLDELVQQGVLCVPSSSSPLRVYTISQDRSARQRLERLYSLSTDPRLRTSLMEQLARRSLHKAASLARRRRASRQAAGQGETSVGGIKPRQPRSSALSAAGKGA
ncbi:MAG: hypothetical protein EPO21_17925 [Chloroflexota bacterium]|nr:MAG: hypothetical protein EPO21_17925 [Chloroflexota bacterium]